MNTSEAEEFVAYAKPIIDRSPQMNEETTKARIIQPLLERLGWDIRTDIELEYSVPELHGRHHSVDYALMIEEKPSLFVEAKGCDTVLEDCHGSQLKTYMKQQNVNWGLLTNGKEYRVMFRRTQDGDVYIIQLGSIGLGDFQSRGDLWQTLTKESIKEGQAIEIAEHIQEINRIVDELRTEKDKIADEVIEVITGRVGSAVSNNVEREAKTFVDSLVSSLKGEISGPKPEPPPEPDEEFWSKVEQKLGISEAGETIVLPDGPSATEHFTEFVGYLLDNGYITDKDIPIESGPTRYILNTEPVDKKGREMYNPKSVGEGLHLETHLSIDDIKRRIRDLGERFGER